MKQKESIVHRNHGMQAEVWEEGGYWHWDLISENGNVVLQESHSRYSSSSRAQHDSMLAFTKLKSSSKVQKWEP